MRPNVYLTNQLKTVFFQLNIILFILFFPLLTLSQSKIVYGNGTKNGGSVYYFNTDDNELEAINEFNHDRGAYDAGFIAVNGWYWSTLTDGGDDELGVIYRVDENGENYTILKSFDGSDGQQPNGMLTKVGERIWGTTKFGGERDAGVIFSMHENGTGYTVEHHFESGTGWIPSGRLLFYDDKLWGVTSAGGNDNQGVIFSINQYGLEYRTRHHFDESHNGTPLFGLTFYKNELWGIAREDSGSEEYGVIYKFNLNNFEFSVAHEFTGANGRFPNAQLTVADGKLWGSTFNGGDNDLGTIFTIEKEGQNITHSIIYHATDQVSSPATPSSQLALIDDYLWGISNSGGDLYEGSIFRVNTTTGDVEITYSFPSNNNLFVNAFASPGRLLLDDDGYFWGLKHEEIFKISATSLNHEVLRNFFNPDGGSPDYGFLQVDDRIWGLDARGGKENLGVVYNMFPDGSDRKVELAFTREGLFNPQGTLTRVDNELFGISNSEIYIIDIETSEVREIELSNTPKGTLLHDDGILYGLSEYGGVGNGGLFSIDLSTEEITELFGFDLQVGLYQSHIVLHDGYIYGGIEYSNYSQPIFGGIFKYNLATEETSMIFESEVYSPSRGVIIVDDVIWGAAHDQSVDGDVLYRLNLDGSDFEVIHTIDDNIGDNVAGALVEVNGRLWGKVFRGGNNGVGSLFSFNPDATGTAYDVKKEIDLTEDLGGFPTGTLLAIDALDFQKITTNIPSIIGLEEIPYSLNVSSNSSNPILYEIESGDGTITDGTLEVSTPGDLVIRIYQEGTNSHFGTARRVNLKVKDRFDLTVNVTVPSNGPTLEATARLSSNGEVYDEVEVTDGTAIFTDVLDSEYYLQIIPTNGSEEDYYATYYQQAFVWTEAKTVTLTADQSLDIEMLENDGSQASGSGTIEGTVTATSGSGARFLATAQGDPIDGLILYLLDVATGKIIETAITDKNGNFSFSKIPTGDYQIYVDVSGISVGKGRVIPFNELVGSLELSIGVGTDGIAVENESAILDVSPIEESISLYPNPVLDKIFIRGNFATTFDYKILDVSGSILLEGKVSANGNLVSLNVSNLNTGIYFLQYSIGHNGHVHRFIKH